MRGMPMGTLGTGFASGNSNDGRTSGSTAVNITKS